MTDVLADITHKISEALDKTFIMTNITLDRPNTFDKAWLQVLVHKLSIYGISGGAFSILKNIHFLSVPDVTIRRF